MVVPSSYSEISPSVFHTVVFLQQACLTMTFNFSAYLSKIDPTQTYAIKQLTGGVVNLTVRATKKTSTASSQGPFPLHASLVLKQAPPYVAGVGESAPMSQFRQVSTPYISSNRAC
jgi:hypothetical protein